MGIAVVVLGSAGAVRSAVGEGLGATILQMYLPYSG